MKVKLVFIIGVFCSNLISGQNLNYAHLDSLGSELIKAVKNKDIKEKVVEISNKFLKECNSECSDFFKTEYLLAQNVLSRNDIEEFDHKKCLEKFYNIKSNVNKYTEQAIIGFSIDLSKEILISGFNLTLDELYDLYSSIIYYYSIFNDPSELDLDYYYLAQYKLLVISILEPKFKYLPTKILALEDATDPKRYERQLNHSMNKLLYYKLYKPNKYSNHIHQVDKLLNDPQINYQQRENSTKIISEIKKYNGSQVLLGESAILPGDLSLINAFENHIKNKKELNHLDSTNIVDLEIKRTISYKKPWSEAITEINKYHDYESDSCESLKDRIMIYGHQLKEYYFNDPNSIKSFCDSINIEQIYLDLKNCDGQLKDITILFAKCNPVKLLHLFQNNDLNICEMGTSSSPIVQTLKDIGYINEATDLARQNINCILSRTNKLSQYDSIDLLNLYNLVEDFSQVKLYSNVLKIYDTTFFEDSKKSEVQRMIALEIESKSLKGFDNAMHILEKNKEIVSDEFIKFKLDILSQGFIMSQARIIDSTYHLTIQDSILYYNQIFEQQIDNKTHKNHSHKLLDIMVLFRNYLSIYSSSANSIDGITEVKRIYKKYQILGFIEPNWYTFRFHNVLNSLYMNIDIDEALYHHKEMVSIYFHSLRDNYKKTNIVTMEGAIILSSQMISQMVHAIENNISKLGYTSIEPEKVKFTKNILTLSLMGSKDVLCRIHNEEDGIQVTIIDNKEDSITSPLMSGNANVGEFLCRQKNLDSIRNIFLITNGSSNNWNYGITTCDENIFLNDIVRIHRIKNQQSLEHLFSPTYYNNELNIEIVGAPEYSDKSAIELQSFGQSRSEKQGDNWLYLSQTKIETDSINTILSDIVDSEIKLKTGVDATEAYVRSLTSPSILHIATHGFIKQSQDSTVQGLVFANANSTGYDTENDGYLYSQDIATLDFTNTDLVVLSACSTGLKEQGQSLSLVDALFKAGVKHQLVSLYDIDDKKTMDLMCSFYKNLVETRNIRFAYKVAQKFMKEKYKDPYDWGSFILLSQNLNYKI